MFLFLAQSAHALQNLSTSDATEQLEIDDILCPSSDLIGGAKLITDVCWSGVFPIYLGGKRIMGKKKYAPSLRADKSFCNCDKGILSVPGVTTALFLPAYMVTLTTRPYCFPELDGAMLSSNLGLVNKWAIGGQDLNDDEEPGLANQADYQFHFASFPVMSILNQFRLGTCKTDGLESFDYLWISETLPFWDGGDPELLSVLTPEAVVLSNPLAWAAIIYDCVASSIDEPVDKIYFSSGCQGSMFPLTAETENPSKESSMSLIANRAFFFISRIGQLRLSAGNKALCKPQKMPLWKRSTYRVQKMWPNPELKADDGARCFGGAGPGCDDERGTGGNSQNQQAQVSVEVNGANTTPQNSELDPQFNSIGFDPAQSITSQLNTYKIASLNEICTHPVGQTAMAWGEWRTAGARGESFASYLYFQWKDCCIQTGK
jgi:conjugal transfer pilus assembly protein TraU